MTEPKVVTLSVPEDETLAQQTQEKLNLDKDEEKDEEGSGYKPIIGPTL